MDDANADVAKIRLGKNTPALRKLFFRMFGQITFPRKGRTLDGTFRAYVTPGAQLSVLHPFRLPVDGDHQRFIARWVQDDSIVWDIGGNMGLFAFPAALKAKRGQVIAFEPDLDLANALRRASRHRANAGVRVVVVPVALSDRNGVMEFHIADFGRSMNKLAGVGAWHDPLFAVAEKRRVPALRIDDIASDLPPPGIVKIDVEGAEMMVLNGGRKTFERHRPVMFVEGPRELWSEMTDYFRGLNYSFFDAALPYDKPATGPSWNTIAVPTEKL